MDRVLEHEVDEVGSRFDKFIELLEIFEFSALLFIEYVEVVFRGIKLHVFNLRCQVEFLVSNLLITFLQLLLLFLEGADLLVDLLFHHLVEVLLLNLKLLHDASE